jgi:hypothetical protein
MNNSEPFFIIEKTSGRKFTKYVKRIGFRKDTYYGKASATRVMNDNNLHDTHEVVHVADYKPVMVERRNLMSGHAYMEDINTPNYCSPASEAYWSM